MPEVVYRLTGWSAWKLRQIYVMKVATGKVVLWSRSHGVADDSFPTYSTSKSTYIEASKGAFGSMRLAPAGLLISTQISTHTWKKPQSHASTSL